jgi:hypothetical protein
VTEVGFGGRSWRLDGLRNGAHGAGEGLAAVAVAAELAEAGRARRQQDHPARPGPPISRRHGGLQVRAAGDAREGDGPNQLAAGLPVCGSLVRAGLPAFAGELAR